jgi:hypothetical protein
MPVFVIWLIEGLIAVAGTLVGKVLLSMGFAMVVFSGIDLLFTQLQGMVITNLNALPAAVLPMLGLLKIGTCVNMLFTAYATRLTLAGITGGALSKMVRK